MDSQEQARLEQATEPAEETRIPFVGLSLDQLDPTQFSFVGLDQISQLAVKDLVVATNDALNALRQIVNFLPYNYNINKMRDGLLTITNRLFRMASNLEPVGYLTDGIERGIRNTRQGLTELEEDIAIRKIENPDLRTGMNNLDDALDDIETNLEIINDGLGL